MDDCSVNIHTAHDDRMLQHMAYFESKVSNRRNRIRAAIVCRWLGPLKYYRTNYNDNDCLRHSLVDPVAFEQLDKRKHAVQWWRMLGYQPADLPWMELPSKYICYSVLMLPRLVLNIVWRCRLAAVSDWKWRREQRGEDCSKCFKKDENQVHVSLNFFSKIHLIYFPVLNHDFVGKVLCPFPVWQYTKILPLVFRRILTGCEGRLDAM